MQQLAAHSLRAGIATAAGVDEARVGRLLGHAGTMTSRYDRPLWDGILHQAVYAWMRDHPAVCTPA